MATWIFQGNEADHPDMSIYLREKREKGHTVYWATPKLRERIREGDEAYIWRQQKGAKGRPHGIVAFGTVVKQPVPKSEVRPSELDEGRFRNGPPKIFDWVTGIELMDVRLTIDEGMLNKGLLSHRGLRLLPIRNPKSGTVCAVMGAEADKLRVFWAAQAAVPIDRALAHRRYSPSPGG
jgi:hypothetical protein